MCNCIYSLLVFKGQEHYTQQKENWESTPSCIPLPCLALTGCVRNSGPDEVSESIEQELLIVIITPLKPVQQAN